MLTRKGRRALTREGGHALTREGKAKTTTPFLPYCLRCFIVVLVGSLSVSVVLG